METSPIYRAKMPLMPLFQLRERHHQSIPETGYIRAAVARAQADADMSPGQVDDVNEFAVKLERTPSSPRELFEAARIRLSGFEVQIRRRRYQPIQSSHHDRQRTSTSQLSCG